MVGYSKSYMLEHCIDVFFFCGDRKMHVLTDGNFIPNSLNNRNVNRKIQQFVAKKIPNEITLADIQVEQSYLDSLKKKSSLDDANIPFPETEVLVRMFAPMAQLGFYSYDCTETYPDGRGKYVLVASPDCPEGHQVQAPEIDIPNFDDIEFVEKDASTIKCFIM